MKNKDHRSQRHNMEWIKIGLYSQFPEGRKIKIKVNGKEILILNQKGRFFAFEAKCPHVGQSLESAEVKDHVLTCKWHNMRFDLKNGEILFDSGFIGIPKIEVFEIKIKNGEVFVAFQNRNSSGRPNAFFNDN